MPGQTSAEGDLSVFVGVRDWIFDLDDTLYPPETGVFTAVIGRIRACAQGSAWCEVQVGEYRGWLKRAEMFGVTADEVIGG